MAVAEAAAQSSTPADSQSKPAAKDDGITYRRYKDEHDLKVVMSLVDTELSEPYSIFTYRYFLHTWPQLSFLAYDGDKPIGCVVCKQDVHRGQAMRGYVAMLVVDKSCRGKGVGKQLVRHAIEAMIEGGCIEVALEALVSNTSALKLYQSLGFLRDKRLHRYYLNGEDAFRLKLLLPLTEEQRAQLMEQQQTDALDSTAPAALQVAAS